MSMGSVTQGKILVWAAVIAAVVAVLTLVVMVWQPGGSPFDNRGGNNCSQHSSCTITTEVKQILQNPGADDATVRKQLLDAGRGRKPTGTGPWPFVVLDTGEVGLEVRNDPGRPGRQIGSLGARTIGWVDCQIRNDFDPGGGSNPGPVWYRLRWPTNRQGVKFQNSQPSDTFRGWGYAGYLVPAGHDGSIPPCH